MDDKSAISIPSGCKHLHGAMHLIRFDILTVPDPEDAAGSSEYQFSNPRAWTEKGNSDLFDKKKSHDIRESIKNRTLMNPLICRWVQQEGEWVPQVLGGDRRYRALDFLIRKKEMVKDPSSAKLNDQGDYEYEWRSADIVYSSVLCQVYSAKNDLDALALSYAENKVRENFTEGHDVAAVLELRKYGASDDRILDITGKDERWLKETDELIDWLDGDTLKDLVEDRIDRLAAKELAQIDNLDVRRKVLVAANEESQKVAEKQIERLRKKVSDARDEQEIAEGNLAHAEYHKDEEKIVEAKEQLQEAKNKADRRQKEKETTKPRTTRQQVRESLGTIDPGNKGTARNKNPCLKSKDIQKYYMTVLDMIDQAEGKCDGWEVDQFSIGLVKKILNGVMEGTTDSMSIVRNYVKGIEKLQSDDQEEPNLESNPESDSENEQQNNN